ncbi:MAG: ribonuclease J [Candidatus Peribacteraceae bacterium]|nr:ribonuclease J [Candidatus Peribacteraceae bacterium]
MKSVQDWVKKVVGSPEGAATPAADAKASPVQASQNTGKPVPPSQPHASKPHNQQPRQHQQHPKHSGQGGQPKPGPKGPHAAPASGKGLRIYPLGGFEEVGRNCMVIDVDGDLYIVDLGLQFPEENMPGIDYLIPDISSLKGKENRIKAVIFTHGHLDHIGAVQHLLPQLHFPPCYGTRLTMAFVKKRLDEEKLTSKSRLNTVNFGDKVMLGPVQVEFLRVTHSIPDSAAVAIHTPYGKILHTGDFKFDLTPMNEPPADFQRLAELGDEGVLAIIADSTNATKPGNALSEKAISETLFNLMRDAKGRLIVSTFSSLLNRLQQVIEHAKTLNRKVFVSGRSMEENIEIAQSLGYIQVPRGMIRKVGPGMEKIPDREVLILTTGSQGEERASLARMGLGTHQHIHMKKGDTVILSSNPILGNERAVAKVVNNLHLMGAKVFTNQELALHTTGHGYQNDIMLMHRLVRAKHIIPEHGEPYMRAAHADLAKSIGYQENQVHLLTNGEILEFDAQGAARRSKHKLTANDIIIDGRGAGGDGERILDDRRMMTNAGVFVATIKVYAESLRMVSDPLILSRGFVYGSEQADINKQATQIIRKTYEDSLARGEKSIGNLKREVTSALWRFFSKKLDREPMIMPIIIEV